ncbi:hypothetical protein [Paraflavitalea speifideaquila]|uniref:hypothetical protein n=1 Tax=Paraflavitalea speifideaquila TaxID=3076558 RepID=UPI0028E612BB|nr:hypothetical protein [Paraflavitalea speifideiaquila]
MFVDVRGRRAGAWTGFYYAGKIEYEIRRNNRRTYADVDSRSSSYYAALPEYDVSYRDLIFSWNRWVYQQGRIASTVSHNVGESSLYIDLDTRETVAKKRFIDDYFVFGDSLRTIKWKIENEIRKIAGWECRKAIGRIHDSVYVVAFIARRSLRREDLSSLRDCRA